MKCKNLLCPNEALVLGQVYCSRECAPYGHLVDGHRSAARVQEIATPYTFRTCRCGNPFRTKTARLVCPTCLHRLELEEAEIRKKRSYRKSEKKAVVRACPVRYEAFKGAEHNRPSAKKKKG